MPRITRSRIAVPGPKGRDGVTQLAGSGTAETAARSDHLHDGVYATASALAVKRDDAWHHDARLATDIASDGTVTPLTPLALPIGANEAWSAEYTFHTGCSGPGGFKFGLTVPSGGRADAVLRGIDISPESQVSGILKHTYSQTASRWNRFAYAFGWVTVALSATSGATPGDVVIELRPMSLSETSTIYAGSYITARRIN